MCLLCFSKMAVVSGELTCQLCACFNFTIPWQFVSRRGQWGNLSWTLAPPAFLFHIILEQTQLALKHFVWLHGPIKWVNCTKTKMIIRNRDFPGTLRANPRDENRREVPHNVFFNESRISCRNSGWNHGYYFVEYGWWRFLSWDFCMLSPPFEHSFLVSLLIRNGTWAFNHFQDFEANFHNCFCCDLDNWSNHGLILLFLANAAQYLLFSEQNFFLCTESETLACHVSLEETIKCLIEYIQKYITW